MSDTKDKPAKKGNGLVIKLVVGLVLVGAGGGTAYGLMAAGIIGGGKAEARETGPQLIRKGEEDPYAPPAGKGKEEGVAMVHGDGGNEFRTAYYTFGEDFTSNLKNSGGLVQLSLAASTRRDGRVLMWMNEHELAIRSRILVELADTPEEEAYSPEGKQALQKRLTAAINEVLTEQEGFGGVDNVYFRSFIVQ
ncbi:flagellar basal body-associated protein FliL [Altererythrobacter xixiisoli]|uniref:Flagellar protein FliL n=1 Tax=Croceibacterium xixiisoli TaxID=1476466 RepID=A0A6I4TQL3_9SPHN|nr:flagellar basal body-associated FliL family protein [Croceibacterium xixiisoli]MXO98455.1 flagellar basal body-associated protein FliL [Croceibacterium xixiisoli]